jgi:hypothetical protein
MRIAMKEKMNFIKMVGAEKASGRKTQTKKEKKTK